MIFIIEFCYVWMFYISFMKVIIIGYFYCVSRDFKSVLKVIYKKIILDRIFTEMGFCCVEVRKEFCLLDIRWSKYVFSKIL